MLSIPDYSSFKNGPGFIIVDLKERTGELGCLLCR